MNKNVTKDKAGGKTKRAGRPPSAEVVNEMKLTLPSLSVNEGMARAAVGAFVSQLDPTALEISDIKCALSEAVTNCAVHAYPDKIGKTDIRVRLYEDRSIKIEVRDTGVGIPDIAAAREPLFTTDTDGERSGMGFTVMESFCDKVSVKSHPGAGTTVILQKRLSPRQKYSRR